MATVKHIREDPKGFLCPQCVYRNYSHCNHPQFSKLKLKPLIIAPEGYKVPAFCPEKKGE